MPILETIGVIASSGGVTSVITYLATRRAQRLDLSQKTIDFWEGKADNYLHRLEELEKGQKKLEDLKCENLNCEKRK